MASSRRRSTRNPDESQGISVRFVPDEDVEQLTFTLQEWESRSRSSGKSVRFLLSGEDADDGIKHLVDEKLPDEFTDLSKPSAILDNESDDEVHINFRTPKKRRGMMLKAQASASKYSTPSKSGNGSTTKMRKSALKQSDYQPLTPSRRVSFIGEMGPTPSKGTPGNLTPSKSVLKRREIFTENVASPVSSKRTRRSLLLDKIDDDDDEFTVKTPTREKLPFRSPRTKKELSVSGTPSNKSVRPLPSTPSSTKRKLSLPKTPHSTRLRTRAMINKVVKQIAEDNTDSEDLSGDDFSGDDDDEDFVALKDESTSSESASDEENRESDDDTLKKKMRSKSTAVLSSLENKKYNHSIVELKSDYLSEAYFETQNAKGITSNNTLSRLRTPRLQKDSLKQLLSDIDEFHVKPISNLLSVYRSLAQRWLFALREGYNILAYGLGSKRHVLQQFYEDIVDQCNVLVVNGFFPGLTTKDILEFILSEIFDVKDVPTNVLECVDLIESLQNNSKTDPLYLFVHNLDGPALCNDRAQSILSRLANLPSVYLIASIDHINAPLIWDQSKLRRYNFLWYDVTSFAPYLAETSYESSLLIQQSGSLALSSLYSVFKSLTSNAKSIFMMIAKHQVEQSKNSSYNGMPFAELYWKCREAFLVSTDGALRAQLTEFLDHHLIKSKRSSDGVEILHIPIEKSVLVQFIDSQENDE